MKPPVDSVTNQEFAAITLWILEVSVAERMDPTDIKLLRLFATVVESGGLSAAQGPLNLSLSTISGRVRDLEARLGVTLCQRGRSGFTLTAEGRAIYDEAGKLFASIDGFDRRVRKLRSSMGGQVTLGITDNTLTDPNSRIDAAIARFADLAPDAGLTIVTRPPNELLRDIVAGQVHVGIASFPRQALGLTYETLYSERQLFYCGAGHPLFDRPDDSIEIDDVRRHALVARSYWGARDMKIFAVVAPRAVVSDMEGEARLILSNRFLGYLPEHFAARFVAEGRMRPVRPDLFGYDAPFQLAHGPATAHSPVVGGLIRAVLTEMVPRPTRRGGTGARG